MSVDISSTLEGDNSGAALCLLYLKDTLDLNNYQKMLLVRHWVLSGRPVEHELDLMVVLGFDWYSFMNPFLIKLMDCDLTKLLDDLMDYESLKDVDYKYLIKDIFDHKLKELENDVAPSGFKFEVNVYQMSETRRTMVFSILSPARNFELIHFSASTEMYKFTPNVRIMNRGDSTNLLTEESINALKGVIYHMTETNDWNESYLPKSLKHIKFSNFLLDELASAILRNYYSDDLLKSAADIEEEKKAARDRRNLDDLLDLEEEY
jgi:hypothetical protein